MRSQRVNFWNGLKFYAAARQENRSFMRTAAESTRSVQGAKLLYHHPTASAPDHMEEIMVKHLEIRIALVPVITLLPDHGGEAIFRKSQGIAAPCRDIEVCAYLVVIEVTDPAHIIGHEECVEIGADDGALKTVKDLYMVEAVVLRRPEHLSQGFDRRVYIATEALTPIARAASVLGSRRV